MTETLTDEERRHLENHAKQWPDVGKALRIIDAHAAKRARLVAQLEAEKRDHSALRGAVCRREESMAEQRQALVAQVAELTRERDEARAANQALRDIVEQSFGTKPNPLESEVTRLTEALAAAEASHLCPCGEKEARLIAAEATNG